MFLHADAPRRIDSRINEVVQQILYMIEAVRRTGPSYVAAVQWHPEFHVPGDPDNFNDAPLLRDFLRAARETRALHDA